MSDELYVPPDPTLVEWLARTLCEVVYRENPDMMVFPGTPYLVTGGFAAQGEPMPLWQLRSADARQLLWMMEMRCPAEVADLFIQVVS